MWSRSIRLNVICAVNRSQVRNSIWMRNFKYELIQSKTNWWMKCVMLIGLHRFNRGSIELQSIHRCKYGGRSIGVSGEPHATRNLSGDLGRLSTSRAPPVHLLYTSDAPPVHLRCTSDAPPSSENSIFSFVLRIKFAAKIATTISPFFVDK